MPSGAVPATQHRTIALPRCGRHRWGRAAAPSHNQAARVVHQAHDERGQALPFVILFMLVLLGIVALVLDGGYAYAQRRFMQNAADAGALSAALRILQGEWRDATVRQVATYYAQHNGASSATLTYLDANQQPLPDPADGMVPTDAVWVRVTAVRSFPTFMARVLAVNNMTVSAQATARATEAPMPSQFLGLAPLSVPINFYESCGVPGIACNIWDPSYGRAWGIPANEFKSVIDLSDGTYHGSINQRLREWTYSGYDAPIPTGTWLPTVNGDHGNNIGGALRDRITDYPAGTDPDGVIWGYIDLVVWDAFEPKHGSTPMKIHVAKFGRFKVRLTDVSSSRAAGYFMDFIVAGHDRGSGSNPVGPKIIILGR